MDEAFEVFNQGFRRAAELCKTLQGKYKMINSSDDESGYIGKDCSGR
jgi:hypothetical protein